MNFINDLENDERNRDRRFGSTYFDLIENEVTEDEKKITELIDSYAQISENLENLIEKKSVFDKTCLPLDHRANDELHFHRFKISLFAYFFYLFLSFFSTPSFYVSLSPSLARPHS